VPSLWEDFILRNRRILADQMELLQRLRNQLCNQVELQGI